MFVTRILKICAQASKRAHRRPLPVEGVYSGAAGRNSLSLNRHDSSLALITDSAGAQPTAHQRRAARR